MPQVAQEEEKEPTDLGGQGKGDGDDGSDFDLGLSDGGSMDEGDGQTESDSEVEVAETGEEEDQTQRPSESSPASSPLSAAVLQRMVQDLQNELAEEREGHESLNGCISELEEDVTNLTASNKKLEKKNKKLSNQVTVLKEDLLENNAKLTQAKEEMMEALTKTKEEAQALGQQRAEARRYAESLEEKTARLIEFKQEQEKEKTKREKQHQKEIKKHLQTQEELQVTIGRLTERVDAFSQLEARMQEQAQSEAKLARKEASALNSELTGLFEDLEAEKRAHTQTKEQLKQLTANSNEAIADLTRQLQSTLQEDNAKYAAELEDQVMELNKELSARTNQLAQMAIDIQKASEEKQSAHDAAQALKQANKKLESEVSSLRSTIDALKKRQAEQQKNRLSTGSRSKQALLSKIDQLEEEVFASRELIGQLDISHKQEKEDAEVILQSLHQEIATMQNQLETEQHGRLAAEKQSMAIEAELYEQVSHFQNLESRSKEQTNSRLAALTAELQQTKEREETLETQYRQSVALLQVAHAQIQSFGAQVKTSQSSPSRSVAPESVLQSQKSVVNTPDPFTPNQVPLDSGVRSSSQLTESPVTPSSSRHAFKDDLTSPLVPDANDFEMATSSLMSPSPTKSCTKASSQSPTKTSKKPLKSAQRDLPLQKPKPPPSNSKLRPPTKSVPSRSFGFKQAAPGVLSAKKGISKASNGIKVPGATIVRKKVSGKKPKRQAAASQLGVSSSQPAAHSVATAASISALASPQPTTVPKTGKRAASGLKVPKVSVTGKSGLRAPSSLRKPSFSAKAPK